MGAARIATQTAGRPRYENAYLFGAICPARGTGAALALPYAETDMISFISTRSPHCRQGRARRPAARSRRMATTGKLLVPENITPIFLPSRAPELNPVENVWQYLRGTGSQTPCSKLRRHHRRGLRRMAKAHRRAERITSIGMRDWAHVGQPS